MCLRARIYFVRLYTLHCIELASAFGCRMTQVRASLSISEVRLRRVLLNLIGGYGPIVKVGVWRCPPVGRQIIFQIKHSLCTGSSVPLPPQLRVLKMKVRREDGSISGRSDSRIEPRGDNGRLWRGHRRQIELVRFSGRPTDEEHEGKTL